MSKIAIKQFVTATLNAIYNKIARFYDVSVPSTLTVSQSGKVSEWKDRSFDQQHATQNLSFYQPDYDSTAKTVVMGSEKHLTFPVPVNFNGYIYTATKTEGILKLRLNLINLSSSDKTWVEANGLSYGGCEGSPVVGIVFYNQSTISAVDEALINNYLKLICGASGAWPANNTNVNSRFRGDLGFSYLFQFLSEIPIQDNTTLKLNAVTNAHALFYYMRYVTQIPNDLDTSNITDLSYCFAYTAISQFPQLNTAKVVNFQGTWRDCYILTTFPLINTAAGTDFNSTWYNNLALYGSGAGIPWGAKLSFPEATQMYFTWSHCRFSQFPDYSTGSDYINNFGKVTVFWDTWSNNPNLTSFTKINTSSAQTMHATWYNCINLNNIDPIDTRNATNFNVTWNNCALTQESVDNAIISIAAGVANNRTKIISTMNDVLTGGGNSIPGEVNRRSLTPVAGQRVWESWEEQNPSGSNQSIRYVNETIGNIVFNFQENITGFGVKNWLKAKFGLDIPTKDPQLPTTPGLIHAVFDCDDLSRLTISGSTRKLFLSQDSVSQGATTIRLYTDSTTSYTVPIGFNPSFSGFKIQFTADTTINAATIFTVQSITTSGSTVTSIQLLRTTGSGTSIPSNSTLFFGTQTQFIQIGSSSISVGASAFTITLGSTNTISSGWTPAAGQTAYLPQSVNIQSVMQSNTGLALRENAVQIGNTISQWIATTGGNNVTVAHNTLAYQPTLTTDATGKYAIFFNGRIFTFTFLNTFNNGRVYIGTTRNAVLDFDLINLASNSTFVFGTTQDEGLENVPVNGIVFVSGIPSNADDSAIKTWLRNRGSNPLTPNENTTEFASKTNWRYRFGGTSTSNVLFYKFVKTFPLINTSAGTNFYVAWRGCSSLTSFPLINTSAGTSFVEAWLNCSSLTSFPLINTSAATSFYGAWGGCSSLTSFPLINTSAATSFYAAWRGCSGLTSFPLINTSAGTNFGAAWRGCSSLTSFPLINTSAATSFVEAWSNCSGLTSFPLINTSAGTNFDSAWSNSGLTSFPLINTSAGTNFGSAWRGCSGLTSFPLIDTRSGTSFSYAWQNCAGLTSFPLIDTRSGTSFSYAWQNCAGLTSFPLINTSAGTNFSYAWYGCSGLTSFPLINTSAGTIFYAAWWGCRGLTSFPLINTSAGTNFTYAWYGCSGLTSFPLIDTRSGTNFTYAWLNCTNLVTLPALNFASLITVYRVFEGSPNMSSLSMDNFLISLAAGLSNNPSKNLGMGDVWHTKSNFFCFGEYANTTSQSLTNINRRVESAPVTGVNQLWETWETEADSRFVGAVAIKNRNNTFGTGCNQVTYNFSNGISGIQATLWMIAFSQLNGNNPLWNFLEEMLALTSFTNPRTLVPPALSLSTNSRVYRSTVNMTGNPVTAWTPVSGTSNQSLVNSPSTESLHGLTNIVFGNGKGITFNGLLAGGSYTVYIGLARGYYKFTATLAAGVTTATWGTQLADGTGVLSIVLFNGTPTTNQEAAVINWVNFYGSFNNLDLSDPFTDTNAKQIVFT